MYNNLLIDIKQTKISIDTISTFEKIILNADFCFVTNVIYLIEFDEILIKLYFSKISGNLLTVVYEFKKKSKNKFKTNIPHKIFEHLFSEFERLGIKVKYNNEYYSNNLESEVRFYYQEFNKIKGLTFGKITKKNLTNVYFNAELILVLNHNKKRASFPSNIYISDDFGLLIYKFICDNIYESNLKLNIIRNELFKYILNPESHEELNNLILKIQYFFNAYEKSIS